MYYRVAGRYVSEFAAFSSGHKGEVFMRRNAGMCGRIGVALLALFVLSLAYVPALFAGGAAEEEAEVVTLTVWDAYTEEEDGAVVEEINRLFNEKYPDVEIVVARNPMTSGDINDLLRPALGADRGPDVVNVETGIPFIGPIVRDGHFMELTDVWEERGWNENLFPMARDVPDYSGRIFGVGTEVEYVPIYYNVDMWNELGLGDEPQTMEELEEILAYLRENHPDVTPMAFAARDWWPNSNFMTSMLWAHLAPEDSLALNEGRGSWDRPEVREAVQRFLDWHEAGYFIPESQAVSYDEGAAMFYQEEALMHPTGNWMVRSYRREIGDRFEVGSFTWPAPAGRTGATVAFVGDGWAINASTEHPEIAVDYVDFLVNDPEVARMWYEDMGIIPPLVRGLPDDIDIDPLLAEVLREFEAGDIELVPGISMMAPPRVMTFMETNAARLMTGDLDVDSWIEEFDRLWEEGREAGMTKSSFTW